MGPIRGFCALHAPELQPARRMATASAPPVDILAEQVPCPRIDYQQQRTNLPPDLRFGLPVLPHRFR
jgi:hypothetical protein